MKSTLPAVEHHFSSLQSTFFLWMTAFHRCRALSFRGIPLFSAAEHFLFVEHHFSALQSTHPLVEHHISALQSTLLFLEEYFSTLQSILELVEDHFSTLQNTLQQQKPIPLVEIGFSESFKKLITKETPS